MMHKKAARILSIAGSDSSGGAGIQADIKTITMLGGHAMTAITAITAQNSRGVTALQTLDPDMMMEQIRACSSDIGLDAIKIGMAGSAGHVHRLADWLSESDSLPVIIDPVMIASSGAELADSETIEAYRRLIRQATLITPNAHEYVALGGEAARKKWRCAILVTGGDAAGEMVTDRLIMPDGEQQQWQDKRIPTLHSHGTGCTLSSAIATLMGQGLDISEAIERARLFVRMALFERPELVPVNGPLGHGRVRNDAVFPGPVLNQISIGCSDYRASVVFYQLLGLRQIVDSPPDYARFESQGGVTLSLQRSDDSRKQGVIYLEFHNLDQQCAQLAAKGVRFDSMPKDQPWGWREAWLQDPFGNRLCLYFAGEYRRFPPWRISGERE